MTELLITILSRVHRFLSLRVFYRWEKDGNVRFHSLDGKWQGAAQFSTGRFNREIKAVVPHPDGPRWEAFVFVPGQETARESGFEGLADTEVAARRLLREHFGPHLLTERKFGT